MENGNLSSFTNQFHLSHTLRHSNPLFYNHISEQVYPLVVCMTSLCYTIWRYKTFPRRESTYKLNLYTSNGIYGGLMGEYQHTCWVESRRTSLDFRIIFKEKTYTRPQFQFNLNLTFFIGINHVCKPRSYIRESHPIIRHNVVKHTLIYVFYIARLCKIPYTLKKELKSLSSTHPPTSSSSYSILQL